MITHPTTTLGWVSWFILFPPLLFLCGSIPFGYIVGKIKGVDLRKHGSGNIGATNAFRVLGRFWGCLAFLGDFLKGCLPLLALRWAVGGWYGPSMKAVNSGLAIAADNFDATGTPLMTAVPWLGILCGLAAILGHNYTPWLGFKGGKGIATSAGVLSALVPLTLAVSFSLWVILVLLSRRVSIGSIAASISLPICTFFFYPNHWPFLAFCVVAGLLGIYRHIPNMKRLRDGTEPRIGEGSKAAPTGPEGERVA